MFLKISVVIIFSYYFSVSLVHCWDLAVTDGKEIKLINSSGTTVIDTEVLPMNDTLGAITYDPIDNRLFTITSKSIVNIIDLNHTAQPSPPSIDGSSIQYEFTEVHLNSSEKNVERTRLVYDPFTNTLFWIEDEKRIMKMVVNTYHAATVLEFAHQEQEVTDVAVHSCSGYLFWTNSKLGAATVERAALDGDRRQTIVDEKMYYPTAITVDQNHGRIYWVDDTDGDYFQIESADLDGADRQILFNGRHHHPSSIVHTAAMHIFWTDFKEMWSLEDENMKHVYKFENFPQITAMSQQYVRPEHCTVAKPSVLPETTTTTSTSSPTTIPTSKTASVSTTTKAVKSAKEQITTGFCLNQGVLTQENGKDLCRCPPAFTGAQCEIPACHNFCIFGECTYSDTGYPGCTCIAGYTGLRCELNVCEENYCLNDGKCSIVQNAPVCACANGYVGQRCEQRNTSAELCRIICEQRDLYRILKSEHDEALCRCSVYDLNISSHELAAEMAANQSDMAPYSLLTRLQDPFVLSLLVLVIVLAPLCMALTSAVCWLRKRPRIKRRIIVNKNVTPLTCRPLPQPDQCEITIENCCNMNICETPCFEPPQLRASNKSSSKTDEKKTLLTNMENGDDFY